MDTSIQEIQPISGWICISPNTPRKGQQHEKYSFNHDFCRLNLTTKGKKKYLITKQINSKSSLKSLLRSSVNPDSLGPAQWTLKLNTRRAIIKEKDLACRHAFTDIESLHSQSSPWGGTFEDKPGTTRTQHSIHKRREKKENGEEREIACNSKLLPYPTNKGLEIWERKVQLFLSWMEKK